MMGSSSLATLAAIVLRDVDIVFTAGGGAIILLITWVTRVVVCAA